MDDAIKNLMAGNKGGTAAKKSPAKQPAPKKDIDDKVNKSIRMKKSTINLLNKVTFHLKVENDKYTFEDAINDGLKLLAKQKGITA